MGWRKPICTRSCETGAPQVFGSPVTSSGCGRLNAPLTRCAGPDTESVASPAVDTTSAVVVDSYTRSTPGVNAPSDTGPPSVSESVAGTVPPTELLADGGPWGGRGGPIRHSWPWFAGSIQSPLEGAAGACCAIPVP